MTAEDVVRRIIDSLCAGDVVSFPAGSHLVTSSDLSSGDVISEASFVREYGRQAIAQFQAAQRAGPGNADGAAGQMGRAPQIQPVAVTSQLAEIARMSVCLQSTAEHLVKTAEALKLAFQLLETTWKAVRNGPTEPAWATGTAIDTAP